MENENNENSDSSLDLASNSDKKMNEYSPLPYIFKLNSFDNFKDIISESNYIINNAQIKCPSFCILLDHTIAVIWDIYSAERKQSKISDVSQIEWALRFLDGILDKTGKHPIDIEFVMNHCIKIILNFYANQDKFGGDNSKLTTSDELKDELTKYFEAVDDENYLTSQSNKTSTTSIVPKTFYFPYSMTLEDILNKEPETLNLLLTNCDNTIRSNKLLLEEEVDKNDEKEEQMKKNKRPSDRDKLYKLLNECGTITLTKILNEFLCLKLEDVKKGLRREDLPQLDENLLQKIKDFKDSI